MTCYDALTLKDTTAPAADTTMYDSTQIYASTMYNWQYNSIKYRLCCSRVGLNTAPSMPTIKGCFLYLI